MQSDANAGNETDLRVQVRDVWIMVCSSMISVMVRIMLRLLCLFVFCNVASIFICRCVTGAGILRGRALQRCELIFLFLQAILLTYASHITISEMMPPAGVACKGTDAGVKCSFALCVCGPMHATVNM